MVESHKAAILAALAITDELFQARQAQQEMALRLTALSADLSRLLPPGKRTSRPAGSIASPEQTP
jgi:cell division protein ZapA